MKITNDSHVPVYGPVPSAETPAANPPHSRGQRSSLPNPGSGGDDVLVTLSASILSSKTAAGDVSGDVDEVRVAKIVAALREHSYDVNPDLIADGVLATIGQLLK